MLQLRPIEQTSETSARAIGDEAAMRFQDIQDELGEDPEQPADRRTRLRRSLQDEDRSTRAASPRWPVQAPSPEQEISYAIALERSGKHRKALDKLYRALDKLLQGDRLADCDRVLQEVNVEAMNTHLLVGLLTITALDAGRLPSRTDLFSRVRARLVELAPDRYERLLAGLE